MKELFEKYKAQIAYLFFGGVTTVINIAVYGICTRVGMTTGISNILAWVCAVIVAYVTNRGWVFKSENHTPAAIAKEFAAFIACRIGTGVIDQIIMVVGTDVLGPRLIPAEYLYVWGLGLKIVSNIVVIILNYILSKMIIYTKKAQ